MNPRQRVLTALGHKQPDKVPWAFEFTDPALAKLAGLIGDPMVRNRGTIGGSLANNDPAACYPAAALADDVQILVNNAGVAGTANVLLTDPSRASQLKAIEQNIGITLPHDNKNSGQTLSQLIAEKSNPVADVAYYGVSFGIKAKEADVVAAYKPAHWEDIPEGLKDPEGYWFTIHSGTIGFFVNKDALGLPQTQIDRLHHQLFPIELFFFRCGEPPR